MDLFLHRSVANFDNTPAPMRKAMTYKEGLQVHQSCGAFVHFLEELESIAPPAEYQEAARALHSQFGFGYLDPDLLHCLESTVPPGDVRSVSAFRPFFSATMPQFNSSLPNVSANTFESIICNQTKSHDDFWGGE